jgi:hypothetical protein
MMNYLTDDLREQQRATNGLLARVNVSVQRGDFECVKHRNPAMNCSPAERLPSEVVKMKNVGVDLKKEKEESAEKVDDVKKRKSSENGEESPLQTQKERESDDEDVDDDDSGVTVDQRCLK